MSRFRPRLTYANVMSSIAVFAVLGGGAYAGIDRKIRSGDIAKNAVKTKQLAPSAVKPKQIDGGAVRRGKIFNDAVRNRHIFDGAVWTEKIAEEAVTTDRIAPEAVTTDRIAEEAVTTNRIAPFAVEHARIADDAVIEDKIAAGAVTKRKLANTYLEAVANGPTTVNAGGLNAGQCLNRLLSTGVVHQNGDIVAVTPRSLPQGVTANGVRAVQITGVFPNFIITLRPGVRVCNVTGAAIGAANHVIDWELLRR